MQTLLILSFLVASVYTDDEHVCLHAATVDTENIESQLEKHESTLILFYAPWCGHCKRLMPEYDEVCKKVNENFENKILCGRVDCTKNEKICKEHELKGYPTIKLLKNKRICEYEGPRAGEKIYDWLNNVQQSSVVVNDLETVQKMISDKTSLVSHATADSELFKMLDSISCKLTSVGLVTVSDISIAKSLGISENSINIFKAGQKYKELTVNEESDILKLVLFYAHPILQEYNAENGPNIFSPHIKYYLAYVYKGDSIEQDRPVLEEYGTSAIPNVRLFLLNSDVETSKDIVDHFHIQEYPAIVFYNDETSKFHHMTNKEINIESLTQFAKGCIDKSIPAFVKKQPIPENWDKENVKILVVDNFKTVFEKFRGGLVMFHAPWCGHCKAFMTTLHQLGDYVQETYPDLFVAKFDHTENDIDEVKVEGYPTIIAFKSPTEQIPYTGDRSIDDLKTFIANTFAEKTAESKSLEDKREDL